MSSLEKRLGIILLIAIVECIEIQKGKSSHFQ